MDRAKELRQMMKSAGRKDEPASNSGALSGKDKLKMMRDMKQQKAEAAAPPPARPSMSKPASAPIKTIDPKDTKFMDEWKKSSSILPAGFFDGGKSSQPAPKQPAAAAAPMKPAVSSTVSIPTKNTQGSFKSEMSVPKAKPIDPPTASVTNLPMEFFDNAREELVARGVNLKQHILEQKKDADKEFQSFLEEIDEIKEAVDEEVVAEVQDEAALKEYEEQAIQMAYMAKLAVLYNKSDAVVGATAPRVVTNVDDQQIENSLREMDSVIASNSSSSGVVVDADAISGAAAVAAAGESTASSGAVKVRQDVEDILYRKLQLEKLKKRKLQVYSQSVRDSLHTSSSNSNKRHATDSHTNGSTNTSSRGNAVVVTEKEKSESEYAEESESEADEEEDDELDYSNLNYSLWKH